MMSIKRRGVGIFKIFFGSGLSQLLNFILVVIVTRIYGDSELSTLVKIIALSSFIVLAFEAGCNYLIVSRSERALKDVLIIRIIFLILVTIAYFSIFELVKKYFNINFNIYLISFIFSLLSSLSNSLAYYFQGRGNINKYALLFFGRNSLHFTLAILAYLVFKPLEPSLIWLLIGCTVNILLILTSFKFLSMDVFLVRMDNDSYSTFKLSFYYLLSSVLVMTIIRAEAILLGNDDYQLAIYFQAKTFAMAISLVSSSFSNYYLSNFNWIIEKGWLKFRNQVFLTYLIVAPFLFITFYFSDVLFFYLFDTDNNKKLREIFTIIGFAFSLGIITNSLSTIIIKAEVSKFNFYLNLLQMVLVILGGAVLINFGFGAIGLSIAILMAHIAGFLIILIYTETNYDLLFKKIVDPTKTHSIKSEN